MHHIHNPLHTGSHLLPNDRYKTLCDVRDTLAQLSQAMGTAAGLDDRIDMLLVDRNQFARLFGDLSFQITASLEGTSPTTASVVGVRPC
jgi:hypothetical protein